MTQVKIDVLSLTVGSGTGVVMALLGFRYWSLVGMALVNSIVGSVALLITVPWFPGPPSRRPGIRSMLHFGGLATCDSFVVFVAWNAEKLSWVAFGERTRLDCMDAHFSWSLCRYNN